MNTQLNSIWPIDRTQSGFTTTGQSGSGGIGNEGVLHIPQSSRITWASPSDYLVLYPRHSLGDSYPSVEKPSVYSTAPADKATVFLNIAPVLGWVISCIDIIYNLTRGKNKINPTYTTQKNITHARIYLSIYQSV